ncbi:hypothetical protein [endosymbiont of Ridgeia piscesae]|jgi:hypothetical protein|uniref:Uncharacterized protein n=1 Tax=endosymbiont of Ridgeia piscesae TaxID=54398 RepID=A0A0T5Z5T3_9GAMM|nr:hypothetical protein [endosymbiont of Ridgeia piscesae]KRT55017.1 hypothetical protein Ga0074115_11272 [endosymbiont of Ridgeia piscesae]KRT58017.1 hypothetical protein Ga0076813_127010 [endosymbiont of Ridgeia piscesae]
MDLRQFLIVFGVTLSLVSSARADEVCVRKVFRDFCLGGSLAQQLQHQPAQQPLRRKGERVGVIYRQDRERLYVMAYKGRIYKVLRSYDPASYSTYRDLQQRLTRKYGTSEERSQFPERIRSRAARISAARRGEGEFLEIWSPPGQAWRVELSWSRKLGVTLAYLVNDLDRQQKADHQIDL